MVKSQGMLIPVLIGIRQNTLVVPCGKPGGISISIGVICSSWKSTGGPEGEMVTLLSQMTELDSMAFMTMMNKGKGPGPIVFALMLTPTQSGWPSPPHGGGGGGGGLGGSGPMLIPKERIPASVDIEQSTAHSPCGTLGGISMSAGMIC
jgi:hypothetical protein